MTTTPDEPLRDEDMETVGAANTSPGTDADGTDTGTSDADGTDSDSDSADDSDSGDDSDSSDS